MLFLLNTNGKSGNLLIADPNLNLVCSTHDLNKFDVKNIRPSLLPPPILPLLIECEWCTEVFPTISKAIQHKFRKHKHESTNYFCKQCGKLFPLNCALEQHMLADHPTIVTNNSLVATNAENELFICIYCKETFATAAAVDFHENGAHQIQRSLLSTTVLPPPSKKIRLNNLSEISSLYYCHLCGCEYMLKYNLRKHLESCHTLLEKTTVPENGIIRCKACEAIFYNDRAYLAHNVHHKPDDLYVTSEEQRFVLFTIST